MCISNKKTVEEGELLCHAIFLGITFLKVCTFVAEVLFNRQ